ncbi:hypothetical protein NST84_19965 [Paenibacillus sp. FSL R7-0345]|uniref:hypothetical protein n=1 Tax=Paenibacillus sp. FSL R7-0345 TaxID=2954535 RepID=UPI00315A0064
MNETILTQIEPLLEDHSLKEEELTNQLNRLISLLEIGEQAELHGHLNKTQLVRLYELLPSLSFNFSAKEHITWKYFNDKVRDECQQSAYLSRRLLDELSSSYRQYTFLALESIVIVCLKADRIDPQHVAELETLFSGRAFHNEAAAFKRRNINGTLHDTNL